MVDDKGSLVVKQFSGTAKREMGGAAGEIESAWKKVNVAWLKAAAGAAVVSLGLKKLVGSMQALVHAAEEQRKAVAGMETAMKSMGRFSPGLSKQMQELAVSLQQVTNFGDEATLQGIKFLVTYRDITNDLLPRSVEVMQDLAALMGGGPNSLVSAANMLGKASMGMTGELRRVGITVDSNTFKLLGYRGVLDQIARQVEGQARAMRDPWSQVANVIGDTKENLGALIGVAFEPWANDMIRLLGGVNEEWSTLADRIKEARRVGLEYEIEQIQKQLATGRTRIDLGGIGPDLEVEGISSAERKALEKKLSWYQGRLRGLSGGEGAMGVGGGGIEAQQAAWEAGHQEELDAYEEHVTNMLDAKDEAARLWQEFDEERRGIDQERNQEWLDYTLEQEMDHLDRRIEAHELAHEKMVGAANVAYAKQMGAQRAWGNFFLSTLTQIRVKSLPLQLALLGIQTGIQYLMAVASAHAAANLAIATIPPPAGEIIAAERLAWGMANAQVILAQGAGSALGMGINAAMGGTGGMTGGGGGGGSLGFGGETVGTPAFEQQKGTVTIYFNPEIFMGDPSSMETLAEKLAEFVKEYDVYFEASDVR
jgi:hypothetical protein